jgi:hypothetical protein
LTEIIILIVFVGAFMLIMGGLFAFLRRNNSVCAFLLDLNNEIHRLDTEDAEKVYQAQLSGDRTAEYSPSWRREEFATVSYDRMLLRPWRSLQSFYREGFPKEPK